MILGHELLSPENVPVWLAPDWQTRQRVNPPQRQVDQRETE